MIQKTVWKKPQ